MFFGWVLFAFGGEHVEGGVEAAAGFAGADDGVDVASLGGYVGVGETLAELFYFFGEDLGEDFQFLFFA